MLMVVAGWSVISHYATCRVLQRSLRESLLDRWHKRENPTRAGLEQNSLTNGQLTAPLSTKFGAAGEELLGNIVSGYGCGANPR